MFDAVSLNTVPPAADLNFLQEPAHIDGDSQVGTDQFFQYLLECIEVSEDRGRSSAVSLAGNQFLDIDILLMEIPLFAVPHIDRVIFQADPHELLELWGGSFTGDSFCRVGKDDVIVS
jgi:hypothetical protein